MRADGARCSNVTGPGSRDAGKLEKDRQVLPGLGEGWSVIVNGRVEAVDDEATIARLSGLGLHPWGPDPARRTWIVTYPTSVSGRRVAPY